MKFTCFISRNFTFRDKIKNPLAAGIFISRNCCPAPQPSVLCAFSISKSPLNWPLPRTTFSVFTVVMRYAIKHYFIYGFSYTNVLYLQCSEKQKTTTETDSLRCSNSVVVYGEIIQPMSMVVNNFFVKSVKFFLSLLLLQQKLQF